MKKFILNCYKSDYLILKFSKWFSDFGKSLWRPLFWILIFGILGYTFVLSAEQKITWGWPLNAKDIEGFFRFIFEIEINKLIENKGFWSIGIILMKMLIFYNFYNFIRATRRFNRGN